MIGIKDSLMQTTLENHLAENKMPLLHVPNNVDTQI